MTIKTHSFIFESSGVKVSYRNVNPLVAIDVRASMQKDKPKPPVEKVNLAGVETEMPNEDDPTYIELVDIWEEQVNRRVNEVYIKRSKLKFDYPNWEQEVAEYKEDIGGDALKEADAWTFLTRIIATSEELKEFYALLSATSAPSPEEVEAARQSFRS